MSSEVEVVQFDLIIGSTDDIDSERLDSLTRQLRDELREAPVESVNPTQSGEVPPNAKSAVEAYALGSLLVAVLPTLLPKVIEFLQSWLQHGENRTLKIKVQKKGKTVEVEVPAKTSPAELKALIDAVSGD